ncbi:hypothetical protein AKJ65_05870 [candidate division MSBL1 archaeon SCGC-AAA259E19]|uniref:Uncharacterized protein n=1 Tax=candidate division MSBL1 archaeon SCGC-AAA259E19 TaxID=1698264 RepID=A0A133UI54_9EURY|nr:hypothetical protein AKJ65_05870 [candidate division MSBL1 archaeon SCGC-AAA259E19]
MKTKHRKQPLFQRAHTYTIPHTYLGSTKIIFSEIKGRNGRKPNPKMSSEPPNVLLTSRRGEEKYLLDDLENLGEFKGSEFRDVVIGWVEDKGSFLSELTEITEELKKILGKNADMWESKENSTTSARR